MQIFVACSVRGFVSHWSRVGDPLQAVQQSSLRSDGMTMDAMVTLKLKTFSGRVLL